MQIMFTVLRGGCNTRHPSTFVLSRPEGLDHYVLLNIKTPAIFTIGEKTQTITPNLSILIPPGIPYSYQNPGGEYIDDWIHFSTDKEGIAILNSIKKAHFYAVKDSVVISEYIRHLLWESNYSDPDTASSNIDLLMQVLFNHLKSKNTHRHEKRTFHIYQSQLQSVRISMQSSLYSPVSAEKYAEQMCISKSRFLHIYTEYFGISFQKDLIQMRILYAKDLLETTEISLAQIAEAAGYASEVHFYRQFRQHVGQTPKQYRMTHAKQ
ncbi:MAG: AraC family transcriptional regulator [Lachnospiraceae bacterium]|nr:AraC family transcriptional regulator [Lachnospiraceae bacterium]